MGFMEFRRTIEAPIKLKLSIVNVKVLLDTFKDKLSTERILEIANKLTKEQLKVINNE